MRLFLASDDLGKFPSKLAELMGNNRKILMITNARDHRTPEARKKIIDGMLAIFTKNGFDAEELDLKPYFSDHKSLEQLIQNKQAGCIFCMGGNLYSLATALEQSGMRNILQRDIIADKYVYGGYSAGAMNASNNLMYYANTYGKRADDSIEQTRELYGKVFTNGLGLIDEYVCPHADTEDYREIVKRAVVSLEENDRTAVVLNDADAFIIHDDKREVLRG